MSITSGAGTLNFPFLVFDTFRFPAEGDVYSYVTLEINVSYRQ